MYNKNSTIINYSLLFIYLFYFYLSFSVFSSEKDQLTQKNFENTIKLLISSWFKTVTLLFC